MSEVTQLVAVITGPDCIPVVITVNMAQAAAAERGETWGLRTSGLKYKSEDQPAVKGSGSYWNCLILAISRTTSTTTT